MNEQDLSPTDLVHHDSPSSQSRKRKATSAASGRGVASLTPEQLAKKRANDREAQRAIRERTKTTIETLEKRIQELTSQQPYQELQTIIRQKEVIQAENDEIRKRLANIMSIIQPIVGAQGLSDLAGAAQQNTQISIGQQPTEFNADNYIATPATQAPRLFANSSSVDQNAYPSPFPANDQEQENSIWTNSRSALIQQRESMQRNHELSENGERLNFNFLLAGLHSQTKASSMPSVLNRHDSPNGRIPHPTPFPQINQSSYQPADTLQSTTTGSLTNQPWSMLPKNGPATCPLDNILLNFLQARQRENAGNPSGPTYVSPAYPSVSSLLNPSNCDSVHSSPNGNRSHKSIDPLSHLMTSIISKFPAISALPEQAGTLFGMFLFMRWQISPTSDNFERMPEWLRPTQLQISLAHPAWMDHLFWPRLRDRVIANQHNYPFEEWFLPFTSGLSVNWPYEDVDCLIQTQEGAEPVINPVFERHIRRAENWTVGPTFAEAFPELADCITIRQPKPREERNQEDYSQSVGES